MNILKWLFNPAWFTFSFGGGGGGSNTTTGTTYTSNIPEYLRPYVETMMGATEKEIYNYDAKGNISGLKPFKSYAQYDQARGGTGETVAGFTPMQVQAMQGIQNYQLPNQGYYGSQMAGMAGLGSLGAGQQYAQQATNPYATQAYMSPYMEGAVAPELREAARQSAMQGQANQAQAVQQGAFGGGRQALMEAERQRNLATQQADIYGKGMQNAFQQAQQAQQFGANLGLQGYGQALQGAQALGALGQQQYGQEMGLLGQQQALGKTQQEYEQNRLNQIVQDYATSQQYPLMQLGVLNAMTRGLPMQASSTQMYQAAPSAASQIAGGLGTTMQLYNMFNQQGKQAKEGGIIKMAAGGIATGVPEGKLPSMLQKLSDPQLTQKDQDKETDPVTKEMVDAEQARRNTLRGGIKTMATGGAIAFNGAERSDVEDKEKDKEKKETTNEGILKALDKAPTTPVLQKTPVSENVDVEPKVSMDTAIADAQRRINNLGITEEAPAAQPVDNKQKFAEYEKYMEEERDRQRALATQSVDEVIRKKEEAREKAGFKNPVTDELATLAKRQAKINEDAKELAQDRLAQFLIKWGQTPGPALNGYINAGADLVKNNVEDKRIRKQALEGLEDARLALRRGEYARRLGDEKEAQIEISKAGEQLFKVNDELKKHREALLAKEMNIEGKIREMELKGEIATLKGASKTAVVQQAEAIVPFYMQKFAKQIDAGTMTKEQVLYMAVKEAWANQAAPMAAQTAVIPQLQNAATNVVKSDTDISEAETKRVEAITKRNEKIAQEINSSLVLGQGRQQVLAAEEKVRKANGTQEQIKAAGEAVANKIRKDIEAKYPLPQPVRAAPAAPAPAPAKAKKEKEQDAVPPLPPGFKTDKKS